MTRRIGTFTGRRVSVNVLAAARDPHLPSVRRSPVMRGALLLVAMAVLATACALFPPPGSRAVAAQVKNQSAVPVELSVKSPTGTIQGAVQGPSLLPGATGRFTFFLPPGDDYWIMVNETSMFPGSDIDPACRQFQMEVNTDGSGGIGCAN